MDKFSVTNLAVGTRGTAKEFRMAPPVIAQKVAEAVKKIDCSGEVGEFFATGPYVNVRLNKEKAIAAILEHITDESQSLGLSDDQGREPLKGHRAISFSHPIKAISFLASLSHLL